MSELIQTRKDVPSGTIILNRPERKNALSRAMISELQQAFDDFLQAVSYTHLTLPTICSV